MSCCSVSELGLTLSPWSAAHQAPLSSTAFMPDHSSWDSGPHCRRPEPHCLLWGLQPGDPRHWDSASIIGRSIHYEKGR